MAELEVQAIRKSYGKRPILKEVSFSAPQGTCTGILGANGSGKSTLFSILAGAQRPDRGEFLWEGTDLLRSPRLRASTVGYVPQGTPLLQELTALDNLSLWYEKDQLKAELEDGFLAMLGIGDFLKTPVHKMSGGMKKRLSIGCAIASHPKVLLLDEPCAALDLVCKERILNYFREHRSQGGVLLLATHDVQELELCDQCFLLKDGILSPYTYDGNVHRLVGCL
jgi:ABC-2 type transport system ATP-binding protein